MARTAMKALRLFTVAVCAAAVVPRVAHRGMFVDGVTYASIARNLALGRGSFWSPSYTATVYPRFYEHPPLGFWLQSWWFRIFGDHLFVERLYTVTVAATTGFLIAVIWRALGPEVPGAAGRHETEPTRQSQIRPADFDWLPILLWIAVPVVSWSIVGNLLETTVSLFTTAALAASLCAARDPRDRVAAAWAVLSGLCVVGAALTKGPVGLFPLVAPCVFVRLRDARRTWTPIAGQWIAVTTCGAILALLPAARSNMLTYVHQQVLAAIAGDREVSAGSFTILTTLLQGVWLPMAVVALLSAAMARRFVTPSRADRDRALCFLVIGLAGTLPILASAKQAGHYLVPAVPAYAIGVALLIYPTIEERVAWLQTGAVATAITAVTALLVVGAGAGAFMPGFGRDRNRLADLDALASALPRGATVGICPAVNTDWGLHAWFERLFQVSLEAGEATPHDWFLKTNGADCAGATCAPVSEPGRALVLMRCRRGD